MTTKYEMGFAASDGQTLIDTAFRHADGIALTCRAVEVAP